MANVKSLSRREFSVAAALAALSGVAITISACGGGGSSPSAPSPSTPGGAGSGGASGGSGDKVGSVSANHGHTATITAAQLTAAGDLRLDITGQASHPHSLELTAAEVVSISGGTRVSKESSTDSAHSHTVTFN